ncbi:conserved hypothetical protein [Borreliella burgdorferi WI91-23]|nr:conserved hypothetical protein [Borreliella burgdorferi WI91-23]
MIYRPEGELVINSIFKVKEDLLHIFKKMKEGILLLLTFQMLKNRYYFYTNFVCI